MDVCIFDLSLCVFIFVVSVQFLVCMSSYCMAVVLPSVSVVVISFTSLLIFLFTYLTTIKLIAQHVPILSRAF